MILFALITFLTGVLLATFVSHVSIIFWGGLAAIAAGLSFVHSRRTAALMLMLVLSVFTGAWRFGVVDGPSLLQAYVDRDVQLTGYVDGEFLETENGGKFPFHVVGIGEDTADERVLIYTERWPSYKIGTPLMVSGTLQEPWEGDGFDYRAYLKKDGVRTVIYRPDLQYTSVVYVSPGQRLYIEVRQKLIMTRDFIAHGVQMSMPEPASAYINGILLGLRRDLPADISDAFSRTGTTHVLAISGYNVTIIAAGFMLLCLRVTDRRRAVWLAIAGIAAFALLTGASASVVRAAIMGSLVLVSQAWGRNVSAFLLVMLSAVIMVLANPYLLRWDVGFQLSFAAVLGLIFLAPWFERAWSASGWLKTPWQLASATGAANIATLPLILAHFGILPVYALPANLLILPVVPYAMAWGAGAGIISPIIPPAAVIAGIPAWALATWQLTVVKLFSRFPWASIQVTLSWLTAFSAYAVLMYLYLRYGNRRGDNSA